MYSCATCSAYPLNGKVGRRASSRPWPGWVRSWVTTSTSGGWSGCGLSADGSTAAIGDKGGQGVFRAQRTYVTTSATGTSGILSGPQYSSATLQFMGSNVWLLTSASGNLGSN